MKKFIEKMPNKNRKLVRGQTRIVCSFCKKIIGKKETNMHMYVCEKVPQEMLNLSLQNTLGW